MAITNGIIKYVYVMITLRHPMLCYETESKLGVKLIFFVFPFLCDIDVKYINVLDVHLEMQKILSSYVISRLRGTDFVCLM